MTLDELIKLGNEWKVPGKHRIYLNKESAAKLIGFEFTKYGTGNIKSASLKGKSISNSKASSLLTGLINCYYDVLEKKFNTNLIDIKII